MSTTDGEFDHVVLITILTELPRLLIKKATHKTTCKKTRILQFLDLSHGFMVQGNISDSSFQRNVHTFTKLTRSHPVIHQSSRAPHWKSKTSHKIRQFLRPCAHFGPRSSFKLLLLRRRRVWRSSILFTPPPNPPPPNSTIKWVTFGLERMLIGLCCHSDATAGSSTIVFSALVS
jgi:hypothetical protein